MKITDPLQIVTPERLGALGAAVGVQAPVEATLLGQPGRQARYGLRFSPETGVPAQVLWVDRVPNPAGFALHHHLAALTALQYMEEVPTRATFQLLPVNLFGVPAAICPFEDVVSGARVVSMEPGDWRRVVSDLGSVLAALHDTPAVHFGTRADTGRYVPLAGSWREEWSSNLAAFRRGAIYSGTDLGWMSDDLMAAAVERLDALDGVEEFSIVHGGMMAKHLFYRADAEGMQLVFVEGWDESAAGDPLIDIAHALSSPPEAIRVMLSAYGLERARGWFEPDVMRRLELYCISRVLRRTRIVADLLLNAQDPRALEALDLAYEEGRFVLEPGAVRSRLEAALAQEGSTASSVPPQVARDAKSPARERLRTSLGLLRVDPLVDLANGPLVLTCLGAALLGYETPAYCERTSQVVDHLVVSLPRYGLSTCGEPASDRAAWLRGLATESLEQVSKGAVVPCASLSLLAFAVRACVRLDWTVSALSLPRIEALVRGMRNGEWVTASGGGRVESPLALTHAILGLAALRILSEDVPGLDEELIQVCRGELESAAMDATERIVPGHFPTPTRAVQREALDQAMASAIESQMLTRPVLVYALQVIDGTATLPDAIDKLVGFTGQ